MSPIKQTGRDPTLPPSLQINVQLSRNSCSAPRASNPQRIESMSSQSRRRYGFDDGHDPSRFHSLRRADRGHHDRACLHSEVTSNNFGGDQYLRNVRGPASPRLPACDNDEESAMFLAANTTWHSSPGTGPRSGFSKQRPTGLYIFSALRASRDLGRSSSNVQSSTQAGAEKARLSYRIRNPLRRRCGHICSTNQFDRSRVSREAMTMHIIGRHVSEPSGNVLACRVGQIARARRPALGA